MELIGIRTPIIKPGDDVVDTVLGAAGEGYIEDEDILIIASSVISTAQNRIKKLEDVEPSKLAKELAEESGVDARFVEIIIRESDKVLSPGDKCILTIKDGMLLVNAGADQSNVPEGNVLLLPEDMDETADELRKKFEEKTGKRIGLILADSHVQPLRLGTTGQALSSSGIKPALDCRDKTDLYGRKLRITFRAIADQLTSAAQLVMGESDERTPVVIVRGVKEPFSDEKGDSIKIPPEKCVYSGIIDYQKDLKKNQEKKE